MAGMPAGNDRIPSLSGGVIGQDPGCRLNNRRRPRPRLHAAETLPGVPYLGAVQPPDYLMLPSLDPDVSEPSPCRPDRTGLLPLPATDLWSHGALGAGAPPAPVRLQPQSLLPGVDPQVMALLRAQAPELVELAQYGYVHALLSRPVHLHDFQDILRVIADFTAMEVVELFVTDWQSGAMLLTEHHGPRENAFRQITEFMPRQGYPGLVAARGEPVITNELLADARYLRTRVKDAGFTNYVCVPLFGPRNVQGALGVASRRPHADLEVVAGMLNGLSRPLGAALSNAILDARDSVADIPPEAVADPLGSLERLLQHALVRMLAVSGAGSGTVTLRDPASGAVTLTVQSGAASTSAGCNLTSGGAAQCPASQGLRTIALDGPRRTWPEGCQTGRATADPALCLPLVAGGVSLGTVTLRFPATESAPAIKYAGVLSAMVNRAAALVQGQLAWHRMWQAGLAARQEELSPALQAATAPEVVRLHHGTSEGAGALCSADAGEVLDIRCFGDFQVLRNGVPLAPRAFVRRQALTALKVLLAKVGQKVPKDVLVECLWPDDDSGNGVERLHVVMNALRKALEPQGKSPWLFVHTDGDAYYWNTGAPYRLDVQEFNDRIREAEKLEYDGQWERALTLYQAAARLYRGDFLNDEPYSDWCSPQRELYREQYITLMRTIAQLAERQGDLAGAVRSYQRALETDPLREEVMRELMQCLWQAGRRDEALRQYTLFRNRLLQELDTDPLSETRALFQQIAGEPVLKH